MKILIVDDEPGVRRFLGEVLKTIGHEIDTAVNGVEALERIAAARPEAVLSDVKMPAMDGMQLLEKISELDDPPPVILLTGFADFRSAAEAVRLGAFEYLTKPVDLDVLTACLLRLERRLEMQQLLNAEKRLKAEAKAEAQAEKELKEEIAGLNAELKNNLSFLEALLDTIPHPVFLLDAELRLERCNSAFYRIFAHAQPGGSVKEFVLAGESGGAGAGEALLRRDSFETVTVCADGQKRIFLVNLAEVAAGDGRSRRLGVMLDLTERKRIENQLRQSEKMQAIGQLAAGVAHEINNPVGYIKSNLGTLQNYIGVFLELMEEYRAGCARGEVPLTDRAREILEGEDFEFILDDVGNLLRESIEGTDRVRDIVLGLKSFSRVDEGAAKEADVNSGIDATLKVVWNELKYKCTVTKDLGRLPRINCNLGQLNQVFMNLLVNAAHAIEEKGEIRIATRERDGGVEVTIADTGKGIPPENLKRIFDPFFTTKEAGKGTGLGLAISLGIVEEHGGTMEVKSEVGKGTTFTVFLPARPAGKAAD